MRNKYKTAYNLQTHQARKRGIEWKLTYQEWLAWWGDDIERRGVGHDKLQMQRFHDKGAYEIGNIKKGYPRDNAKTSAACRINKNIENLKKQYHENLNNYAISNEFAISDYDDEEESIEDFMRHNGTIRRKC